MQDDLTEEQVDGSRWCESQLPEDGFCLVFDIWLDADV